MIALVEEHKRLIDHLARLDQLLATCYDIALQDISDEVLPAGESPANEHIPLIVGALPERRIFLETAIERIMLLRRLAAVVAELNALTLSEGGLPDMAAFRLLFGYSDCGPEEFERLFPTTLSLAAVNTARGKASSN